MVAGITRLRRPFLGEILAGEPDRIGDGIDLDELAEGRRAFQPLRNLAIAKEHHVSVRAATCLECRHAVAPQTMLDLQAGNSLLDVRDGGPCRPLICGQPPKTPFGPAIQPHELHSTVQPIQLWSGDAMRSHRAWWESINYYRRRSPRQETHLNP